MKRQRGDVCPTALMYIGAFFLAFWSTYTVGESGADLFGKPVKYSSSTRIEFPGFTVRFVGTRHEASTVYPRGFLYYDFEIRSNTASVTTVSWSSGTGELAPVELSIDGRHYFLELKADSLAIDPKKRWLKEDELIIWRKEVYLEKQKALMMKRE
ncbi:MAG: hypothetical protein AB9873_02115 [Syntrophobacteraceae bacterium]